MSTPLCDEDCSAPACGDEVFNASAAEQCDASEDNSDEPDASCRPDCKPRRCGDAITDPIDAEACDAGDGDGDGDGVADDAAACDFDCSAAQCGDGYANQAASEGGDAGDGDGDGVADNAAFCDLDWYLFPAKFTPMPLWAQQWGSCSTRSLSRRAAVKPIVWSFIFGLGARIDVGSSGAIMFDARYDFGLTAGSEMSDDTNASFQFTAGYQTDLSIFSGGQLSERAGARSLVTLAAMARPMRRGAISGS